MKNLLKAFAFAIALSTCYNCSVESAETNQENLSDNTIEEVTSITDTAQTNCVSQDPQARLINNSLVSVDFEVFDQFGILMTHAYGVPAGNDSATLTFPDGITTFVISTSTNSKSIDIDMGDCMVYEVEINENNQLNTDVPIQL
ncbi:hypothetical protein AB9K26_10900 [Psychroserpens sp. XS_ASV72]|uniref:hypothetical protein n=1 Tax=Psychroserpens sp. XS_ASV72 TaxID=3241293 RepID=UPI0035162F85